MRRDFKISRSAGALLNRSLLRVAKQDASVLAWIACAATHPPCGQAEALPVPTPGLDASVAHGTPPGSRARRWCKSRSEARGVRSAAVLAGTRRVPRHEFMPENVRRPAASDRSSRQRTQRAADEPDIGHPARFNRPCTVHKKALAMALKSCELPKNDPAPMHSSHVRIAMGDEWRLHGRS